MADNEFTVFVGPSGCGKSTILRMIAGLEDLTAGEVWMDGKPVSHLEPKDRDIAMVFQDYALYPHMNVARNMSFALKLAHFPKKEIERRLHEVAVMLGIENLLHRKPKALSGGQRQRVAMGRALVRDASTFLFDEPLSNLDAKLRAQMRTELGLMRRRLRKNMIYVTHDQIEAMTLGDRIVVIKGGEIMQIGSPFELYTNPANKFVAGFIGSPSMNFLNAELIMEADQVNVKGNGFCFSLPLNAKPRLAAMTSRNCIVGIRPSAFLLHAHEKEAENLIELSILVSEYIGSSSVLVTQCGDQQLTVSIRCEKPVTMNAKLCCRVAPESIHLFDTQTEAAL
jgi:multiple sugar transport system ATP-binding protein